MPVILSIGYRDFLMKNEAQALAAMKALSTAVAMERDYVGHRETYVPAKDDDRTSLEMKIVKDDQIRSRTKEAKAEHKTIHQPAGLTRPKAPLLLKFGS